MKHMEKQASLYEYMTPQQGDTIVVWFSCGAASAIALQQTISKYGDNCIIRAVNNPIADEDPDNRRFLKDVENWLNIKIEEAINSKYPNASCQEVWDDRQYMSGIGGAPCTNELKKKARQQWEAKNPCNWIVLGFTADKLDAKRYDRFVMTERDNCLPILIEKGITKDDCFEMLAIAGIKLPITYELGMPNANCYGCVKVQSPGYWALMRNIKPDVFQKRAEFSRQIGCRLVKYKGERIFLDELPEDIKPWVNPEMSVDCGIFCEERIDTNEKERTS